MILGKVRDIKRYKTLNSNLNKAIEWLESVNLKTLNFEGKKEIDGLDIFAMLQEYKTFSPTQKKEDGTLKKTFEGHKKYTDIQIVLSGREVMEYAPLEGNTPIIVGYNEEKDIYKANPLTKQDIVVEAESFAAFFPEDLHKPCMDVNGEKYNVKKLVVKVLL